VQRGKATRTSAVIFGLDGKFKHLADYTQDLLSGNYLRQAVNDPL
jgi:hypothetical protein